ncbi:MAG: QueT transporter family protein [Ruminococcaceae bacterium]|nr:QueT transporter family protein [Oscillospiraceae bacterium]
MQKKTQNLTQSALIAALYVALTYLSALLGIASGVVQVRLSEALTILPAFNFSAVPGLFIGCFVANLLTGAAFWDVVFGSCATLLGAFGTYYLGKKCFTAPIFPILSNTLIIPFVLKIVYGVNNGYQFLFVTIFVGEFISCGILGVLLYKALSKTHLFKK